MIDQLPRQRALNVLDAFAPREPGRRYAPPQLEPSGGART